MKKLLVILLILTSNTALTQESVSPSARADELIELVNDEGILWVAQLEGLDQLDLQLLSLMLHLDLDDKAQAKAIIEQRAEFELQEDGFILTGSRPLHDYATHATSVAQQQFRDAEIYYNQTRNGMAPRPNSGEPLSPILPLVKLPHVNLGPYHLPTSLYGLTYALWVANATALLLDEVVAFYQQYGSLHILRAQHIGLQPQHTAVLQLGNCFMMRHYSLGIFFGTLLLARIPPEGQNMTPAMSSEWHPWDRDPCIDTWEFGPSS